MATNNIPQTLEETFARRGIKRKQETLEQANFLGKNGKSTFSQIREDMAARFLPGDTNVAVLGEFYSSARYQSVTGGAMAYEDVYGQVDYSKAVENDSSLRPTLDEVFGNNDNDPTGEAATLSETEAQEVIAQSGETKSNFPSLAERHRATYNAQRGMSVQKDEDTRGIRGVEDFAAPIEPIA